MCYDVFWSECKKFLDIGSPVDNRRHGSVTHLPKAISVCGLREQVQAKCPGGTTLEGLMFDSWYR